jgi:glyoxylase-like metal-dependent hydrolase (beta-lactamase superfamily II)
MPSHPIEEVADQVYRCDTGLYRRGFAACYLIRSGDRLAFADTGTARTVPDLLAAIRQLGLGPDHVDFVIPTHVHLDHAGGSGDLMAACANARLVVHPKGATHMMDPGRLIAGATDVYGEEAFGRDYGTLTPIPEGRVTLATDGLELDLAGRTLTFVDTPGHANHHGCIWDPLTRGFFTGDTFGLSYREFDTAQGPWVLAPTTPVAFDPDAWLQSLDRIMAFDPQAMYLTHYGRIERPDLLVDGLRQCIRDLAAMALAEEGRADPGRAGRLKSEISDYFLAGARAHGVAMPDERVLDLLAMDIDLNAQGLDVWLIRRERRAGG